MQAGSRPVQRKGPDAGPAPDAGPPAKEEDAPKFAYSAELDPELKARFNRMVIAMDKKAIRYGSIDDVRPKTRAHLLSTAHHVHTKQAVPLSALRALKDGKDLDGNVWYRKAWEQVSTWGGLGDPRPATDAEVEEKAKENAYALAKSEGSDYVSGDNVNCAYEGYEPDDERRKPNLPAVPVSKHVTGGAIDLSKIQWDKLGGRWSEEAVKFVASFGLTRPFSPNATTYCIEEHWHFELATPAPAKEEPAPKGGKP